MSRHDQEQEQEQDWGLGLWPLVWLILTVVAIGVGVLGDQAHGNEAAAVQTVAVYATGDPAHEQRSPGLASASGSGRHL